MEKYNYSVIIPHYNSWGKLKRLLKTIPYRKDIQIIVVDDGSEEKEILEGIYAYTNVEFYKNKSGVKGAGKSRNIGLEKAKGKWVVFADSDDFFLEGAFKLMDDYLDEDSDIVYFNPTSQLEKSEKKSKRHSKYSRLVVNYFENINAKNEKRLRNQFLVPWSKMIKRELINQKKILFDEVLVSNDVMFSIKSGLNAEKVTCDNRTFYCVTDSFGTLTKINSEKKFDQRFSIYLDYVDYLKDRNMLKYGTSALNYILKSKNYGINKLMLVIVELLKKRARLFPGVSEILERIKNDYYILLFTND